MPKVARAAKLTVSLLSVLLTVGAMPVHPQTPAASPGGHFFVRCKLLINPATGQTVENAVIEVGNGKILRAGAAASVSIPTGAVVIDASDKYVIPGLVDTHAHMYGNLAYGHSANEQLPLFHLAAGVTSVLSPGSGNPEGEIALRNRIDAGDSAGPRIFAAGEYIEMAPTRAPGMPTVETREEARLKINHWASRGADAIKIYAGMRGEILDAAVARAHAHGARVTAHLGATGWADAIRSGVDVIYHGVYSFPEIEPEWMDPKAIGMINFAPPEFDKYYKAIVEADLSQPKIRELFRLAAAAKVVFVPTVVALEPYDAEKQRMPDQKQFYSAEGWQVVEKRLQSPKKQYAVLLTKKNMEFVRLAHEAGCMLSTGTDLTNFQILPGFALWREIELFAEAGLKPMDVLRAATFNGAYAVGRSDSLGTVEGGKLADFVILNANPLENISNVRSVHRVVKGGVVYDPQELLKRLKGRVH